MENVVASVSATSFFFHDILVHAQEPGEMEYESQHAHVCVLSIPLVFLSLVKFLSRSGDIPENFL